MTLTGCGVPTEDSPRPIAAGSRPNATTAAQTASPAPGVPVELLFLVRDAGLVAVRRPAVQMPAIDEQLRQLLAGPNATEREAGYTSALTGITVTGMVEIHGGDATVGIGSRPDGAGRSDEVLAYGQIVCTLTSRADVRTVSFLHDGQPLRVPRADASLTDGPLTAADYTDLIRPA
ncbi:GerMN domain-containing protein [Dactylosporangium aurantiacum]|uniref:GerMN domain-containing protein n=2 Tax=Dactylosporangium aurantiacum TaxID=35754 RepID=A0A9Q9IPA0_9ACTN|nr:GerMN domain-containing protein [Dactylosporangium aurantiacum]MDG6108708.1 GerMN domain-containing protein [Dactylosporangium aurantiacum]UWZ59834.1 GerMN domain-containing protein [Dactylosporangium aurantiacum]